MNKVTRIFGPPGTGKTTTLINIVEEALSKGIQPEEIAYLSFSTKAAQEAIIRAKEKFNIESNRFKFFRTIHSLGFYSQSLRRDEIMDNDDYKSIADALGLEITNSKDEEDTYGNKDGDNCRSIMDLSRAKMQSLEEEYKCAEMQVSVPFCVVEQWFNATNQYKKKYGKSDFSDMLERYKGALPVKILIVDEAQDLSKLQWKVIKQASYGVPEIYIAGDDDQCIYAWNGADVESFLNYEADENIVLPKSYRVPQKILGLANEVSLRIERRKEKSWEPSSKVGSVYGDVDIYELPLDSGEWFLLARNYKFLENYKRVLQEKGLLYFDNKYGTRSIGLEESKLIMSWQALRNGSSITMKSANDLIKQINPKLPLISLNSVTMKEMPFVESFKNKEWYDVLAKALRPRQIEYIRSCLRNGQKLTEKPRITISTIHRAKGGEAENVAIIPDYSYLSSQYIGTDEEHRVQYVGITRAKENLYLISPQTEFFYEYN